MFQEPSLRSLLTMLTRTLVAFNKISVIINRLSPTLIEEKSIKSRLIGKNNNEEYQTWPKVNEMAHLEKRGGGGDVLFFTEFPSEFNLGNLGQRYLFIPYLNRHYCQIMALGGFLFMNMKGKKKEWKGAYQLHARMSYLKDKPQTGDLWYNWCTLLRNPVICWM